MQWVGLYSDFNWNYLLLSYMWLSNKYQDHPRPYIHIYNYHHFGPTRTHKICTMKEHVKNPQYAGRTQLYLQSASDRNLGPLCGSQVKKNSKRLDSKFPCELLRYFSLHRFIVLLNIFSKIACMLAPKNLHIFCFKALLKRAPSLPRSRPTPRPNAAWIPKWFWGEAARPVKQQCKNVCLFSFSHSLSFFSARLARFAVQREWRGFREVFSLSVFCWYPGTKSLSLAAR